MGGQGTGLTILRGGERGGRGLVAVAVLVGGCRVGVVAAAPAAAADVAAATVEAGVVGNFLVNESGWGRCSGEDS